MSAVIRQFLVFFLVVLVVKCSQSYTISYPDDNDLNEGFEPMRQPRFGAPRGGKRSEPNQDIDEFDIYNPDAVNLPRYSSLEQRSERFAAPRGKRGHKGWPTSGYKFRAPRPGKRTFVLDSLPSEERTEELEDNFKRDVLRSSGSRFYRNNFGSGFIRIGRSRPKDRLGFLRIGKSDPTKRESFLRIGRGSPEEDDSGYIRMGRPADLDKRANFLRIGRGSTKDDITEEESEFLRIGRSRPKRPETRNSFLRIGRAGPGYNLTADDMKFLLSHREDVMNFLQNSNVTHLVNGYFALPRQGRAMSFYFPRLGRSSDDVTEDTDCCPEGVRNVFEANKGSFEICPRAKSCCVGLQEKTKLYSNTVLVECTRDTSLEKIRELINEK